MTAARLEGAGGRNRLSALGALDTGQYPSGIVVYDAEMAAINIERAEFHGEWNYTISPNTDPQCFWKLTGRAASTTLANSIGIPSPVVLKMRPRCCLISGSISSRRCPFRAASVFSSSPPIRREYPTTSAANIAAKRRSTRSSLKVTSRRQPSRRQPASSADRLSGNKFAPPRELHQLLAIKSSRGQSNGDLPAG
jgi:hypothetical protein